MRLCFIFVGMVIYHFECKIGRKTHKKGFKDSTAFAISYNKYKEWMGSDLTSCLLRIWCWKKTVKLYLTLGKCLWMKNTWVIWIGREKKTVENCLCWTIGILFSFLFLVFFHVGLCSSISFANIIYRDRLWCCWGSRNVYGYRQNYGLMNKLFV